jgi:hypothetical protein
MKPIGVISRRRRQHGIINSLIWPAFLIDMKNFTAAKYRMGFTRPNGMLQEDYGCNTGMECTQQANLLI